jgi:hypothetical protein
MRRPSSRGKRPFGDTDQKRAPFATLGYLASATGGEWIYDHAAFSASEALFALK